MAKRLTIWSAPVLLLVLAALSIYGAFLGADAAGQFFSSVPVLIFWAVLLLDFGLAIVLFPGLRNRPGLLMLHVGPVLVILGAMYGSQASHRLRNQMGLRAGPESGYLVVREGHQGNTLRDQQMENEVGSLPFQIKLNDFRMERYEMGDGRWDLFYVERSRSGMSAHGGGSKKQQSGKSGQPDSRQVPLEWKEGGETGVEDTGIRVEVLRYISSAEPTYGSDSERVLRVVPDEGDTITVPAREGETLELEQPAVKLRITRVFSNLKVRGMGKKKQIVDAEGDENPALKLEVERVGQEASREVLLMPRFPMHGQSVEGITLQYDVPDPTGAKPSSDSSTPAMKVRVRSDGEELTGWLLVQEGRQHARLSLAPLFEGGGSNSTTRALFLARPGGPPKSYKSDLVVMEEGEAIGKKTVEVNDPLHYGGYHLYQSSYDRENHSYTVLLVRSDDGLWLVYAGFLLLGGGAIWFCWGEPIRKWFKKLGEDDEAASRAA